MTIGMDLGDRENRICVLNADGKKLEELEVMNTARAIDSYFGQYTEALVALEAGTHSPWISRKLEKIGRQGIGG